MMTDYQAAANELSADQYDGMMLWAAAVQKAGSIDRLKVIESLGTGVGVDGPSGPVAFDPATHHTMATHHTIRTTYLGQAKDRKCDILATFPDQHPNDPSGACDLLKTPDMNKQLVL